MTVALYARVAMRGQDPQPQVDILRDYCQRQGFVVHDEYVDMGQYITETLSDAVRFHKRQITRRLAGIST